MATHGLHKRHISCYCGGLTTERVAFCSKHLAPLILFFIDSKSKQSQRDIPVYTHGLYRRRWAAIVVVALLLNVYTILERTCCSMDCVFLGRNRCESVPASYGDATGKQRKVTDRVTTAERLFRMLPPPPRAPSSPSTVLRLRVYARRSRYALASSKAGSARWRQDH